MDGRLSLLPFWIKIWGSITPCKGAVELEAGRGSRAARPPGVEEAVVRTAAVEAPELGTAVAVGEAGKAAAAPCRQQVAAVVPTRQQIGHLGGWCLAINNF